MELKRILTIQDISCFGKCSLTAALPVLSAMGIETCVIPTAVLSTHTGGFTGYTYHDLTDDILPITEHWEKYNISFDAIYTGYLGSIEQIEIMENIFSRFGRNNTMIFIDPVMGDNGAMYAGFTEEFAQKMRKMCAKADVIAPNMTEAALLLGTEYREKFTDRTQALQLMHELAQTGAKKVILTGVSFSDEEQGAGYFDSESGESGFYMTDNIKGRFHGTGDLFSSAAAGVLVNGGTLYDACKTAVDFVLESIKATVGNEYVARYGVNFEAALPMLIRKQ